MPRAKRLYGGIAGIPDPITGKYKEVVTGWFSRNKQDLENLKNEISDLETKIKNRKAELAKQKGRGKMRRTVRGGAFDPKKDIVDGLAGPAGWIMMGIRKARERKIAKLKKELESLGGGKRIGIPSTVNDIPLEYFNERIKSYY